MAVALLTTMGLAALPAAASATATVAGPAMAESAAAEAARATTAGTWRSASATGSGRTTYAGEAAAIANARAELNLLAASLGETCTNVTVSTPRLVYTAPDGSAYVYQATATGYCTPAPAPPAYTVPRSATSQGGGSNSNTAIQNGSQAARAVILTAGVDCTNWTTTSSHVYTAPDGSWYIYNVTVNALCVQ